MSFYSLFLTYQQFAEAEQSTLFAKENIESKLTANYLSSSYLENKGKGSFALVLLPLLAQFAPINAIWVGDINHDTHAGVLTVGNNFSPDFVTGRYDASCGLLMLGNGRGQFKALIRHSFGRRHEIND